MNDQANRLQRRRPPVQRGRSQDRTRDDLIISAALELLAERGYRDLTMTDVAARAGVSKATLAPPTPRFGPGGASVLSVLLYVLTQLSSGSLILCLLARCCGAGWAAERYYTKSLLAPLLSHAIWTPTVLVLLPVTST